MIRLATASRQRVFDIVAACVAMAARLLKRCRYAECRKEAVTREASAFSLLLFSIFSSFLRFLQR